MKEIITHKGKTYTKISDTGRIVVYKEVISGNLIIVDKIQGI